MNRIQAAGAGRMAVWLLIIALAATTRFYRLSDPFVWTDEAFSVLLGRHSPVSIWMHTAFDVHPPLYYELLHYWMKCFGDSPFVIRSMSAVMGVAAVALGMWLTRLVANRHAAIGAGLMLSLLPIAVRYSQEARMYTLMVLLLFAATIALIYWVRQPSQYRFLLAYVVLMSCSFYTHYFTALCVISHWGYLGVWGLRSRHTPSALRRLAWWLANVAIVLAYVPWLYTLWGLLGSADVSNQTGSMGWIKGATLGTLPAAFWRAWIALSGQDLLAPLQFIPPLLMFILSMGMVLKDRSQYQLPTAMVIYTYLPLVVVFLVSLKLPMFMERYVVFALMGMPIVLALLLEKVRSKTLKWGLMLLVVALELVGLRTLYCQREDIDGSRSRQDLPFEEMAAYVARASLPGDRMVVDESLWYFSVIYYNESPFLPQLHRDIDSALALLRYSCRPRIRSISATWRLFPMATAAFGGWANGMRGLSSPTTGRSCPSSPWEPFTCACSRPRLPRQAPPAHRRR